MSSGRNRIVDRGRFGRIEFIHTRRPVEKVMTELTWDHRIHLWRASVALAMKDLKHTHRVVEKEMLHHDILREISAVNAQRLRFSRAGSDYLLIKTPSKADQSGWYSLVTSNADAFANHP